MVTESVPIIDIGFQATEKKLLLVVDDEASIHGVIFDALDADYRLISAFNGREGVTKAVKTKPSLILMDLMMPEMGGYEAVRVLNDDPSTRVIPIIVMTAQNFDESTVQLLKREPNVYNFLPKPFRAKDLRATVANVLDRAQKPS